MTSININIARDDFKSLFANIDKTKKQDKKDIPDTSTISTDFVNKMETGINKYKKNSLTNEILIADTDNKILDDATEKGINCSGCDADNLVEIDGFNVCQECGLYNDCVIDSGQEWRYYGADDSKGVDPARADIPTNELLPHSSMGSLIGFSGKETQTTKRVRNMIFWNSIPYRETSLLEAFNNITIMAQNAGISQCIIEEAKIMYKKVSDVKSSRRTKKEAMKAGCIMLACKLKGVPRSCSEIAKIFKIKNNKTLRKSIKTFEEIWNNIQLVEKGGSNTTVKSNKLGSGDKNVDGTIAEGDLSSSDESDFDLSDDSDDNNDLIENNNDMINSRELDTSEYDATNVKIIIKQQDRKTNDYDSCKYLHRFCSNLGLDDSIYKICLNMLIKVEEDKCLERHNPLSRTASVLFYVVENLNLHIKKQDIVQTCKISDVTITKCYHKILKSRDLFEYLFV